MVEIVSWEGQEYIRLPDLNDYKIYGPWLSLVKVYLQNERTCMFSYHADC